MYTWQLKRERGRILLKKWRAENRKSEATKEKERQWRAANPEKCRAYTKKWKAANQVKMAAYARKRRSEDVQFKIKGNLRSRLWKITNSLANGKTASTQEFLGCSPEELMHHLSSRFSEGMSWSNYGKWHVDHIRQCSSFDLTVPEQQRACFHFTNLQPLWGPDNLKKNSRPASFSKQETVRAELSAQT